ncbi:MAG: hypothetical protein WCF81_11510 [Roseiarcus sp.]
MSGSEEGDWIGKRGRVDEFQRQAVLLRELPRVGDEEGDVAETVDMSAFDG